MTDQVLLYQDRQPKCPKCHGKTERMLKPLIKNGTIISDLPKPMEIQKCALEQLKKVSLD